ncbi:XRE family transcriptional regulator [Cryobacterium sp. TmT2-59]|uniref:helix-turn-helix domain-containing protein n=1 Tax=Cryobacterium sp. TmT2-59 TaxID=1259264 RepID=UPI0010692B31|nr:XRE family transcriptional regulator [Cryobacterium sp. TmT2-59]TFC81492.1 XRE family transcriptional regulator [Cryobacterium sp. TmT2-59]
MSVAPRIASELSQIAPRLRRARERKNVTLAELAKATGISTSTLSRLESGQRKPSLELLLPIVAALAVSFEEIVTPPQVEDPRVLRTSTRSDGRTFTPLSQHSGEPQTFKISIPATDREPQPRTHVGFEWIYVLSGPLRLILGEHDIVMQTGEAAEFDTRNPHWFGSAGRGPVELLSMFGKQGERIHVRARSTAAQNAAGAE